MGGLPRFLRFRDPSNFLATGLLCHLRMVSGLTMVTVSAISLPRATAFSARRRRSQSLRRIRLPTWLRRTRFSSIRYSILASISVLLLRRLWPDQCFGKDGLSSPPSQPLALIALSVAWFILWLLYTISMVNQARRLPLQA